MELYDWILGDNGLTNFADALEGSGCATQLVYLTFERCEFGAERMQSLADRLGRDAFPELQELYLYDCPSIADVGAVALVTALREATQTSLTKLCLHDVGMSDEGITALASLVSQRRLEELQVLDIAKNAAVTEQGIIALARAINARGLPELR